MRFFPDERTRGMVVEHLRGMPRPVTLRHTTRRSGCRYCPETLELLQELAGTSEDVSLEVIRLPDEGPAADALVPATSVLAGEDRGIRYLGIPSGFEFPALLDDILMVARDDSGLSAESRELLRHLDRPLLLQVFVTPSCPYCAGSVRLAHQFAMESDLVKAEMIETTEFAELAERYAVRSVPVTVANGRVAVVGAMQETAYLARVLLSLGVGGESPS